MKKMYLNIDTTGLRLDEVVLELIRYSVDHAGALAKTDFNGKTLYSDSVSLDSAYSEVIDNTYSEYANYDKETDIILKHALDKPGSDRSDLIELYKDKGREVIDLDKINRWDEEVEKRVNGISRGYDLGQALDIIEVINANYIGDFYDALEVLKKQNNIQLTYEDMFSLLTEFCNSGEEFVEFAKEQLCL